MAEDLPALLDEIRSCRLCAEHLDLGPRPIVQGGPGARVLIIGQAPGTRVHASGVPWDDDSGERLRDWTGLDRTAFYNPDRVALMPMGFCYPGKASGGDLPPRPECAPQWHERLRAALPGIRLTLLVGQYAVARYLPAARGVTLTETVLGQIAVPGSVVALPHPAWRVRMWMQRNPDFAERLLPALRDRIAAALA